MAVKMLKFRDVKANAVDMKPLEPIFVELISLLSAYLNGESRKNELYLGRHLDFILGQIEDPAVLMLT